MGIRQLTQVSTGIEPLADRAFDARFRVRTLIWVAVLGLLTIGPGAIGYTRSVDFAETLILGIFLWSLVRKTSKRTPIDLLVGVWLLSQVSATVWGYATGLGSHSPYPEDLYAGGAFGPIRLLFDTLAAFMAAYCVLWNTSTDESAREGSRRVAPILIAAAAVVVFTSVEQICNIVRGTTDPRIEGTFSNPNLLGAFVCIALPLAVAQSLSPGRSCGLHVATGALAALLAITLVLSQSRGAFLGCAIGLIYIFGAAWAKRAQSIEDCERRGATAVKWMASGCIAMVVCALLVFPHVLHQSRSVSDEQRRTAWLAATLIIHAHPLTGIGADSFPAAMAELRLKELNPITSNGLPLVPATHLHAHDLLLQAWVERGIVGALVVCALILLVLRKARRLLRSSAAGFDPVVVGAVAALLASFAQNVADYTLWYAPIAILFWIVIGLVFASE